MTRKLILLVLLLTTIVALTATDDYMKAVQSNRVHGQSKGTQTYREQVDVPEYEFVTTPTDLITNFYDYMPGSYCGTPLKIQPDAVGGGIYLTFHGMDTADATRRLYYAYIAADGTVTPPANLSQEDTREGYAGLSIDPETGDPFFAYHASMGADGLLDVGYAYDQYHFLNSPGLIAGPWTVFNSEDIEANPLDFITYNPSDYGLGADEFIWPYTYVGPSPEEGMRRLYVVAKNATTGAGGIPAENILIGHTDFNVGMLDGSSGLDWEFTSIEYLDNMHLNEAGERPFQTFAVGKDGRVAVSGYRVGDVFIDEDDMDTMETFVIYSDNYGESWNVVEKNITYTGVDPVHSDGSYWNESYAAGSMRIDYGATGHFTSTFDKDNNLQVPMVFQGLYNAVDDEENDYVWPYSQMIKNLTFDFETEEIALVDIYPTTNNEGVNALPWDIDRDGEMDQFDEEGYLDMFPCYPVYYWDRDGGSSVEFNQNNIKTAYCEEDEVIAAIWQDSWKAHQYNANSIAEYEDYANAPEIYIAFSEDNGNTWYDPIVLNSVETPELEGTIPEYVYIADPIQKVGEHDYKIHLMWLDDNTYGSSIIDGGPADGGTMQYASMIVKLDSNPNESNGIEPYSMNLKNYPNPFNPETTISYTLEQPSKVNLEIFNVKGQLVKTFATGEEDAGTQTVIWNGQDNTGSDVSSGLYFYKLTTEKGSITKKMMLLK